jgi:uncharacterized protein YcbK (DUF882 family)
MPVEMKYFDIKEFDCRHTGKNEMKESFLIRLDELRGVCGFPFVINSGYRDMTHPEEAKKEKSGTHTFGIAADIKVSNGYQRYKIVSEAIKMGFNGVGIANGFIHIDDRNSDPVMWTY